MSAFSTIVGRLGELSESELEQLYLIVGIRLGIRGGDSGRKVTGSTPNKSGKGKGSKPNSSGKTAKSASKGNPQRKSQWETHPLYREYKRLKKVVETQAKERNLSFAAVDTPERSAYDQALAAWLEAKSTFRDHSGPETNKEGQGPSKGKGKAVEVNGSPAGAAPAAPPSGRTRSKSWADEAQEMADGGETSSEDEEQLPDAGPPGSAPKPTKRGEGKVPLPERRTPPKKPSAASAKK